MHNASYTWKVCGFHYFYDGFLISMRNEILLYCAGEKKTILFVTKQKHWHNNNDLWNIYDLPNTHIYSDI